jgi:HSP20 family protein
MNANTTLDLLRIFFPNEPLLEAQTCPARNSRVPCCNVDIVENDSSFVVLADLPGMERENIKVTFRNNFLVISGERTSSSEDFYSRERVMGRFERRLKFQNVRPGNDSISATYVNGVLRVELLKSEEELDRNVQIL